MCCWSGNGSKLSAARLCLQAEAAVPADAERILAEAAARPGGLDLLNAHVVSAVRASIANWDLPMVQAAACGDEVFDIDGASQEQLDEWLMGAASGGFVLLMRQMLAAGARVDAINNGDLNAIMACAQNAKIVVLRELCAAARVCVQHWRIPQPSSVQTVCMLPLSRPSSTFVVVKACVWPAQACCARWQGVCEQAEQHRSHGFGILCGDGLYGRSAGTDQLRCRRQSGR